MSDSRVAARGAAEPAGTRAIDAVIGIRDLPPVPEYTCGSCDETFGTNCDEDDIQCPECGATRCPHCEQWFGGI